jgi:hypothetical protein
MDTAIDLSTELPDHLYDAADVIDAKLQAKGDLTPSKAARYAKVTSHEAWEILRYLVAHGYAHTSGNGAWTHFHPGR